jgi:hypothetical protein
MKRKNENIAQLLTAGYNTLNIVNNSTATIQQRSIFKAGNFITFLVTSCQGNTQLYCILKQNSTGRSVLFVVFSCFAIGGFDVPALFCFLKVIILYVMLNSVFEKGVLQWMLFLSFCL